MSKFDKQIPTDFINQAKVNSRFKLIADGQVTRRHKPEQSTLRLFGDDMQWLRDNVEGNTNYAIAVMVNKAIKSLKHKVTSGNFHIDDWDVK